MKITIISDVETFTLEVSEDLELENFKVLCEAESGIKASEMTVASNRTKLTGNQKMLKNLGVKDGDLLMIVSDGTIRSRAQESTIGQIDFGAIRIPNATQSNSRNQNSNNHSSQSFGNDFSTQNRNSRNGIEASNEEFVPGGNDDPAVVRDMLLANPEQISLLKHNNPKLADALVSGDLEKFASILREQQQARLDRERQRLRLLRADPFDLEAQKLIANEIQQENIDANMEAAMEYTPESFGTVHMLYIHCKVNGHPVKAFIDSGAQTTIMSQGCAERCNIMRLVDNRWAGLAKGVGVQRIIGRVHMGQIEIEGDFLASSFSILQDQPMDMLLGLDMLKRHQMSIDLKSNHLLIGTTGTKTKFLNESELPECARLSATNMDEGGHSSTLPSDEDAQLAKALSESAQEAQKSNSVQKTHNPGHSSSKNSESEHSFSENDVLEIVSLGFKNEDVVSELRKHKGNKTQVIAALFAKSLSKK